MQEHLSNFLHIKTIQLRFASLTVGFTIGLMAGRPWKYAHLIEPLQDGELYHASKIIRFCESLGLFDTDIDHPGRAIDKDDKKRAMVNARSSLSAMASKRLPKKEDGLLNAEPPYTAIYRAWYGKTWKKALLGDD